MRSTLVCLERGYWTACAGLQDDKTHLWYFSVMIYSCNGMRQNAIDHELSFPQAVWAILESFYVDDGLTGADSIGEAIEHRERL